MQLLSKENFVQVHRSYFVNKNHVEAIMTSSILVKGETIPFSKGFENDIKNMWIKKD